MNRSVKDRLSALQRSTGRVPNFATPPDSANSRPPEPRLGSEPRMDDSSHGHAASAFDRSGISASCAAGLRALGFQYEIAPPGGVPVAFAVGPSAVAAMATAVRTEEGVTAHGSVRGYWRRTLRYDVLTRHGNARFADLHEGHLPDLCRAAKVASQAEPSPVAVSNLRFYDTETSGLGTGAGTFPFLHGIAYVDEDDLVLEQFFLADHAEEHALLEALAREHFSQPGTVIVTFNGKSYDWPLLRSRSVMHRVDIAAKPQHIDLLPLCRRLWKSKLGSVSLKRVEEAVLALRRLDDLPGRLAPERYFEFVETGDVSGLAAVFDHNAVDICSLVVLAARVAALLAGEAAPDSTDEYLALGRWHDEWGESDLARTCYERANALPDRHWQSEWALGMHLKRSGNLAAAAAVWKTMAERYEWSIAPAVELAKYAEHRTHNLAEALFGLRKRSSARCNGEPGGTGPILMLNGWLCAIGGSGSSRNSLGER